MVANELHINMDKCKYMHFRPRCSNDERQTCARTRLINNEPTLKLLGKKIQKVDKVRFLWVIIDDELNWEAQISHLETKLKSSIVMIKRIKKFIPNSEYSKIYNALFESHITYCITCWGGIPHYKLQKLFSIQKRCIRLLFGNEPSYDHTQFYEKCARTRTYEENMAPKNYCLENTKPLFNENGILCIYNLYAYQTFMELFKIMKYRSPISVYELYKLGNRDVNLLLQLPIVILEKSKCSFIFKSAAIWNRMVNIVFNKCKPQENGIVIPGSSTDSDMSASIAVIKNKLKMYILDAQKQGNKYNWTSDNFQN